ncbi:MAG: DNRLRE domain-containing protein [Crocinitomicaceae bacterium]
MKKISSILTLFFLLLSVKTNYSQDTTVTLDPLYDTYVYSGSPTSDYSTRTYMYYYYNGNTYRIFTRYDLSAIPENAIVTSASLKMYCSWVNNGADHPIYIQRNQTDFTGSGYTWNNQPTTITSDQISVPDDDIDNTGWHTFDVKSHVQTMVNYPSNNHGWCMRLQSESGTTRGGRYNTIEYSGTTYDPYLEVTYVMPIEISGYVKHCTNGNSDGEIKALVSKGSGTYDYYEWFKFEDGSTSSLESGSNIANADMGGLAPGLYLLHVEDDLGYKNYRYFLLGEEGDTTTVEMFANHSDTSSMYWEDALLADDNPDNNNSSFLFLMPYSDDNVTYTRWNVSKFKMDFDYLLDIDMAKFYMYGVYSSGTNAHYRSSSSSNKTYVDLITSDWEEDVVTWNIKPSTSNSVRDSIPETNPAGHVLRDDTVDLKPFVDFWQNNPDQNYGFKMEIAEFPPSTWARLLYGSSDHTTAADRPKFVLSFEVKSTITTEWNDTTGLGEIVVNAPNGELPYTYLLSRDSLPPLDSLWHAVKDSIPIDSATFYAGNTNSQTYTYKDILPGRYFVGVYDNNGNLIFNQSAIVSPSLEVFDSTNIDVDGDTLKVKSGSSTAEATMLLSLAEEDDGGIEFEVVSLDGDYQIGFNNMDDSFPTGSSDFEFSADVKSSGKVYFMKTDTIIDSTTVIVGDLLKLTKEDTEVFMYKNSEEVNKTSIETSTQEDWKVEVDLKASASKAYFTLISGLIKKPKLKYSIQNLACLETLGSITISLPNSSYFGWSITSYTIYDENGTAVASGTSSATEHLPAGIYSLSYTYSLGSFGPFTASEEFILSYPVLWQNVSDLTDLNPTLEIYPTTFATEGTANSLNTSEEDKTNWVIFENKLASKIGSLYNLSYNWLKFEDANGDSPISVAVLYFGGGLQSAAVFVYDENGYVSYFFTHNGEEIRMDLIDNAGTIATAKVYDNGVLKETVTSTALGKEKLYLRQYKSSGHIVKLVNARANFCYPKTTSFIAKTKPYTDGSYYSAHLGKLDFQYTGEYNQSDLLYEIKDANGNVVSSGNYSLDVKDGTGILKKNADNRYSIDLSAQAAGFYMLTITNVKGEEHYLRIRN